MKRLLKERLVLIVDDVPLNLLILEQVLQGAGATVIKAANGKEALALLEDHPVEVILTDMQMPEMDGWEMATYIRQSSKWYQQLPIIATTTETEETDRQRWFTSGINDIVYKPIDPVTICQKIEDMLTKDCKKEMDVEAKSVATVDFCLSYLQEVTNGDKKCLLSIVDNLEENGPLLLKQATNSVHKKEWDEVAACLHKLKGLVALFHMHSTTQILIEAEREIRFGNPSAERILERIDLISEQLVPSIQKISYLTQSC